MAGSGRIRIEPSDKRVRAYLAGVPLVDSTRPVLVWEKPHYPTYYFPSEDVRTDLFAPSGRTERSPSRGTATFLTATVPGSGTARTVVDAAYRYEDPELDELEGLVALVWDAMDHWFEEDEEVYVHPRDPYTRVDILQSSRHVRVEIDGVTVADSHRPRLLFETGLPVRNYLPKTDVRMDLLTSTDLETHCPYKGTARYWSVDTGSGRHENVVWEYRHPARESEPIAGLVCFYDEKVDVYVDGVLQERPRTVFS